MVSYFEKSPENSPYFNDHLPSLALAVIRKNGLVFTLIGLISALVAFLVYMNRRTYQQIKYHSEIDGLTQTYNRRAGIQRLKDLVSREERRHRQASLCFIDINGLKEVNDSLGHADGDQLIKSVVGVIKETIREKDLIIRLGGDEFLLAFLDIGQDQAEEVWQRIEKGYEKINQKEDRAYRISVSHGIVSMGLSASQSQSQTQPQPKSIEDLIIQADKRMYEKKKKMKEKLKVLKG